MRRQSCAGTRAPRSGRPPWCQVWVGCTVGPAGCHTHTIAPPFLWLLWLCWVGGERRGERREERREERGEERGERGECRERGVGKIFTHRFHTNPPRLGTHNCHTQQPHMMDLWLLNVLLFYCIDRIIIPAVLSFLSLLTSLYCASTRHSLACKGRARQFRDSVTHSHRGTQQPTWRPQRRRRCRRWRTWRRVRCCAAAAVARGGTGVVERGEEERAVESSREAEWRMNSCVNMSAVSATMTPNR